MDFGISSWLHPASSEAADVGGLARHASLLSCHLLWVTAILLVLLVPNALADELTLKNGHKISGTIVGFENGMFRLETDYGFEWVRKDKVVSVRMAEGGAKKVSPKDEANSKSEPQPPEHGGAGPTVIIRPVTPAITKPTPRPPLPVSQSVNEPLPAHIDQHQVTPSPTKSRN